VTVSSSAEKGRAAVPTRPWRGVSADRRTAQRREQLLEAGLEMFAARGYQLVSLAEVCDTAGLIKRYFYESFADREALLLALTERIAGDALAAVESAVGPAVAEDGLTPTEAFRLGLDAFVDALVTDPRRAQVLLVETVGVSPAVEQRRREIIGRVVGTVRQILWPQLGPAAPGVVDADLTARALVGAIHELLIGHIRGEFAIEREHVIEHLIKLSVAAAAIQSGELTATTSALTTSPDRRASGSGSVGRGRPGREWRSS
jgi:AcrR family transcriptional regulator